MAEVTIEFPDGKKTVTFEALIDSGSEDTLSFAQLAESEGIFFSDPALRREAERAGHAFEDEIEGISLQKEPVFVTMAKLHIFDRTIDVPVNWIKRPMQSNDFSVILGQNSIFQLFDIRFERRKKKFFLR